MGLFRGNREVARHLFIGPSKGVPVPHMGQVRAAADRAANRLTRLGTLPYVGAMGRPDPQSPGPRSG